MIRSRGLVERIAEMSGLGAATVEQHFRKLYAKGLMTRGKRGLGAPQQTNTDAIRLLLAVAISPSPATGAELLDTFERLRCQAESSARAARAGRRPPRREDTSEQGTTTTAFMLSLDGDTGSAREGIAPVSAEPGTATLAPRPQEPLSRALERLMSAHQDATPPAARVLDGDLRLHLHDPGAELMLPEASSGARVHRFLPSKADASGNVEGSPAPRIARLSIVPLDCIAELARLVGNTSSATR